MKMIQTDEYLEWNPDKHESPKTHLRQFLQNKACLSLHISEDSLLLGMCDGIKSKDFQMLVAEIATKWTEGISLESTAFFILLLFPVFFFLPFSEGAKRKQWLWSHLRS